MQGRIHKMKKNYSKIDRATGKVLKQKSSEGMERVFNKEVVWLEMELTGKPDYDEDNEKVVQYQRISADISDLSIDVSPDTKFLQGYDVVSLTTDEKEQVRLGKIAGSDEDLAKLTEDILVVIAQGGTLEKDSFPDEVWEKVNARRVLRGEDEV
jgi:hypothetical protein